MFFFSQRQRCITQDVYDENTARYRKEQQDLTGKIKRLQHADEEYYITATYLVNLIEKAEKLYFGADIDEKRQIIGLICQKLYLDGTKLVYELKKPFDTIVNSIKVPTGWPE